MRAAGGAPSSVRGLPEEEVGQPDGGATSPWCVAHAGGYCEINGDGLRAMLAQSGGAVVTRCGATVMPLGHERRQPDCLDCRVRRIRLSATQREAMHWLARFGEARVGAEGAIWIDGRLRCDARTLEALCRKGLAERIGAQRWQATELGRAPYFKA